MIGLGNKQLTIILLIVLIGALMWTSGRLQRVFNAAFPGANNIAQGEPKRPQR